MQSNNFVKVPKSTTERSTFSLGGTVLDTINFGTERPFLIREIVPTDNFKIEGVTLVKYAPMVAPTFGEMSISHRAFFIPYRLIFKDWEAFMSCSKVEQITGGSRSSYQPSKVPYFTVSSLCRLFASSYMSTIVTGDDYDFITYTNGRFNGYNPSNQQVRYKFTINGRKVFYLLRALGYAIDVNYATYANGTSSFANATVLNQELSAMPILAWMRCYTDILRNCKGADITEYTSFFNLGSDVNLSSHLVNFGNVLIKLCAVYYDDDYFTSSWLLPMAYDLNVNAKQIETSAGDSIMQDTSAGASVNTLTSLNALSIQGLAKMFSFAVKMQLAGKKFRDQLKALFGVNPSAERFDFVEFLGNSYGDISVFAIDVTADGENKNAGDYVGKALGKGTFSFHYKSDEYGLLIASYHVAPVTRYPYGLRKETTQHLTRYDFFTPELDGFGTRPIKRSELIGGSNISQDAGATDLKYNSTFGHTPNYSEYKCAIGSDLNNGDFIRRGFENSMLPFQLSRNMTSARVASGLMSNDESFLNMDYDSSVYNSIFADTSADKDHILLFTKFDIQANRPMKALYDIDGVVGGELQNIKFAGNSHV